MNAVTPINGSTPTELVEAVITRGDLSNLRPEERARYYVQVCQSVGLNPLTKPFEYITLNGKLTLYALRACTDQLRTIHKVSVEELTETEREGVFIVTAKVKNADGRSDMAKGAVMIANLKGDALANAMMKAETKAKRRATLSLCGLGFLDETEIETISVATREASPVKPAPKKDIRPIYDRMQKELADCQNSRSLKEWGEATAETIKALPQDWQTVLRIAYQDRMTVLLRQETGCDNDGVVEEISESELNYEGWSNEQARRLGNALRTRPTLVNDDGLDIPLALRREPMTIKERLLADIPNLGSAADCLHWGLEMSSNGTFETLKKAEKDEVRNALAAQQEKFTC